MYPPMKMDIIHHHEDFNSFQTQVRLWGVYLDGISQISNAQCVRKAGKSRSSFFERLARQGLILYQRTKTFPVTIPPPVV